MVKYEERSGMYQFIPIKVRQCDSKNKDDVQGNTLNERVVIKLKQACHNIFKNMMTTVTRKRKDGSKLVIHYSETNSFYNNFISGLINSLICSCFSSLLCRLLFIVLTDIPLKNTTEV